MNGYKSLHPNTAARLQSLGVHDDQIPQGWGDYILSAGTHEPVGEAGGHPYGYCVDLAYELATRVFFDHLVAAGFAPFVRDGASWAGNEHMHVVDCARLEDDAGWLHYPPDLVPGQVHDWTLGLNGLCGHGRLPSKWLPSQNQRNAISAEYQKQDVVRPVWVMTSGGAIDCYAYWIGETTRVELRPFAEALGARVAYVGGGLVVQKAGRILPTGNWGLRLEGDFARCNVTPTALALGYSVDASTLSESRHLKLTPRGV